MEETQATVAPEGLVKGHAPRSLYSHVREHVTVCGAGPKAPMLWLLTPAQLLMFPLLQNQNKRKKEREKKGWGER